MDPLDSLMRLLEFLVAAYPVLTLYPYWSRHPLWKKILGVKR